MNLKVIYALFGICTLIPLSVDGALAFELGGYTVRYNYLSFVALSLVVALDIVFSRDTRKSFAQSDFKPYIGVALLTLCGLLGLLNSENPKRSLLFLVWTIGTLTTLPLVYRFLVRAWGGWVYRVFSIYVLFMDLVVISDGITSNLPAHFTIGRVIQSPDQIGYRPFGFYQEPNYFAAFSLLANLVILSFTEKERNAKWRTFLIVTIAITYIAIFFCTSKMGIAAILALIPVFVVQIISQKQSPREKKKWKPGKKNILWTSLATMLCIVGLFSNRYMINAVRSSIQIRQLKSTDFRQKNAEVTIDLFRNHPWVGVGPGGSGAYVSKHFESMPHAKNFLELLEPGSVNSIPNDPFFYTIYSETLGEWGGLGLLSLVAVFFGFFMHLRGYPLLLFIISVGAVSLTWQTLPRFDFWTCFSLLWLTKNSLRETKQMNRV